MATIVHLSDSHICDPESPSRLEYLDRYAYPASPYRLLLGDVGTYRPQEILTTHVLHTMIETVNRLQPDAVVFTGDLIDNAQVNELQWWDTLVSGGRVEPWSGNASSSSWVGSPDVPWDDHYWHPDGPPRGVEPDLPTRSGGFPRIPGLVERAREGFATPGLAVSWFGVHGNHDELLQGTVCVDQELQRLSLGSRRFAGLAPKQTPMAAMTAIAAHGPASYPHRLETPYWDITPDARRRLLDPHEHAYRHLVADVGQVRLIGFDTVNPHGGWQGSVSTEEVEWLSAQLAASEGRPTVVLSHHPSWCLTNLYSPDGEPRLGGSDVLDVLLDHPWVVAWLAGHIHQHSSVRHQRAGERGALWEFTAASLIDAPQQGRTYHFSWEDSRLIIESEPLDHLGASRAGGFDAVAAREEGKTVDLARISYHLAGRDAAWRGDAREGLARIRVEIPWEFPRPE